ncbi:MAG: phosphate acetyltransferase, partial [Coriobacteriales bacterium]|nr:phosphate acetyltransferase [Coriobacteriales bacterium]
MSDFLDRTIARAKTNKKTIVLPEGRDPRTLEAAVKAHELGIADLVVISAADNELLRSYNLDGIQIIDPATYEK